jgi:polyhydroxybutyrate depolymerase
MSKLYKIISILFLFLPILACRRANAIDPIPTVSSQLPAGESTRTWNHDGLERSYMLYVPTSVDWNQPVPLVFVFHGGTGNAQSAILMSGFNEVADQNGFIAVYPNGTGPLQVDKLLTWNVGSCCAYAQENHIDDVGFVRAIVTDLQSLASIDEKRIYATGMSNGGMLSQRLGCEASDIFAAIAPVSGTLNFSPCQPSQPISVIEFHGSDDRNVPYDGGVGLESLVGVDFASVQDSIELWISANGCDSQPQTNTTDNFVHEIWTGCDEETAVALYTIIGGGHTWPGGARGWPGADQPTQTISASQLIWEFFAAHPKP